MTRWKRLFYYLLINVLVSACTVVAVLIFWQKTQPSFLEDISPAAMQPTELAAEAPPTALEVQPSPTIKPTRALTTYLVLPGDTLGSIALEFEVDVDELMELNGISDPNELGSGQVLFVPAPENQLAVVIEDHPPVIASTAVESPPAPTEPASVSTVVIGNVFGVGDLETERVRLECHGDGDVSLSGWQMAGPGGATFTFPELTLYPGGAVDIFSRIGDNSVTTLYWGLEVPVWKTGEVVTLIDNLGSLRATYVVP